MPHRGRTSRWVAVRHTGSVGERSADVPSESEPELETGLVGSWVDWMFRDRSTGRITIAQIPNVSLWTFFVTVGVRWVFSPHGGARTSVDAVALVALAAWAVDEVFRGVNPWRRLLGLCGCGFVVTGLVSLLR